MGWVVLGIIAAAVIYAIFVYNGLVGLRQRVNQAFADIDVQLKQRHDLIPRSRRCFRDMVWLNAHRRAQDRMLVRQRHAARTVERRRRHDNDALEARANGTRKDRIEIAVEALVVKMRVRVNPGVRHGIAHLTDS